MCLLQNTLSQPSVWLLHSINARRHHHALYVFPLSLCVGWHLCPKSRLSTNCILIDWPGFLLGSWTLKPNGFDQNLLCWFFKISFRNSLGHVLWEKWRILFKNNGTSQSHSKMVFKVGEISGYLFEDFSYSRRLMVFLCSICWDQVSKFIKPQTSEWLELVFWLLTVIFVLSLNLRAILIHLSNEPGIQSEVQSHGLHNDTCWCWGKIQGLIISWLFWRTPVKAITILADLPDRNGFQMISWTLAIFYSNPTNYFPKDSGLSWYFPQSKCFNGSLLCF